MQDGKSKRDRAAIYARISKDRDGEALGVERQIEDCRTLAAQRGYEVVREWRENDVSASTRSSKPRPLYAEMLSEARDGQLDVILAYSNSRLTRRPTEYNELIDLYETKGVRIETVASGTHDLSTADGRGIARTIAAWDAAEAERTSERVKAAQRQRIAMGGLHGGNPPFGYRYEGEPKKMRLVPTTDEADLVEEATRRLLAGDSLYSICGDWTARGIKTRPSPKSPEGSYWRQGNLSKALRNPSLTGRNKAGMQVAEPLLPPETFERLERLLSNPARNVGHSPGVRSSRYTMTGGLAVCGECGHRMVSNMHRGKARIRCSSAANGPNACNGVMVNHDDLEEYVLDMVMQSLEQDPLWGTRVREAPEDVRANQTKLDDQRLALRDKRDRVLDMYADGDLTKAEKNVRLADVEREVAEVEGHLSALLGNTVVQRILDYGPNWRDWTNAQRRQFLSAGLERVEVRRHPKGVPTSLFHLPGETPEEYEERRREHVRSVLNTRISVIAR
jgi:DNA invertase Pin-like site-specific DNA recombinase